MYTVDLDSGLRDSMGIRVTGNEVTIPPSEWMDFTASPRTRQFAIKERQLAIECRFNAVEIEVRLVGDAITASVLSVRARAGLRSVTKFYDVICTSQRSGAQSPYLLPLHRALLTTQP
ncbi:hypothetical protein VaNZ11_012490, partial [Volvox africanus]